MNLCSWLRPLRISTWCVNKNIALQMLKCITWINMLNIYLINIDLELSYSRRNNLWLGVFFCNIRIPSFCQEMIIKKQIIKEKVVFLPWSDTPNWQGMGMKWLEECVFRSMCAPLVSIWQPEIDDSWKIIKMLI